MNSMRTRMTVAFAVSTSLLMAIACVIIHQYAFHAAERTSNRLLLTTARKIREDLTDDERKVRISELVQEEHETLEPNNMALVVEDAHGAVMDSSQSGKRGLPLQSNEEWRIASVDFPPYKIIIGMSWKRTKQALNRQAILLIELGIFVTTVATIGAWLLVGRTLSPIGSLARQARSASVDSLQLRLNASSEDVEIVDLVSTLNGMLLRISDTVATKGRFLAAASHELRTPLQALSGHLELALNRERSASEYRAFIEEANGYSRRLNDLTHDLLLLHQLDASTTTKKSEVDLADICERTILLLRPRIQESGLVVETIMLDDAFIMAAPTHAEMLVRNLIDNAVKYASGGDVLRVRLYVSDGLCLSVHNPCAPLSESDMTRLFEPFYRPDRARNSSTGGTGLGLAICKAIAEANQWKLMLVQEDNGITANVFFDRNDSPIDVSPLSTA